MELKEFDIMLDIKKSKKIEDIEVVQKDYESNILNISIVEGFEPYNLSGLNVEIAFAKPDGTTVLQDEENGVIIEDPAEGKIRCILNTNTIAASGKVFAEVRILQDLRLLTTARFDFFVRRAIVNDETIESTNEFPILNQLINTTQDLIEQVGRIEKQVPENVVTQLNEVSDLANQLQVDLAAHKADKAKYQRFGKLTNQSIPNATNTQIYFETNQKYNNANFAEIDETTGQIRILEKGIYQIDVYTNWATDSTGTRGLLLPNTLYNMPAVSFANYVSGSSFLSADANSLLSIRVSQTSGSALDLSSNSTLNIRQVVKL